MNRNPQQSIDMGGSMDLETNAPPAGRDNFASIKVYRSLLERPASTPAILKHPILQWVLTRILTTAEKRLESPDYCYRCEVLLQGDTSRLERPLLCAKCGAELFAQSSPGETKPEARDTRSKHGDGSWDLLNRFRLIAQTGVDPVNSETANKKTLIDLMNDGSEIPFCIFTGTFLKDRSFTIGPFMAPAALARRSLRGHASELDEMINEMIIPFLGLYGLFPGRFQVELHWGSRIARDAASHPRYQRFAYKINDTMRHLKIEVDLSDGPPNYYECMLALVSLIASLCREPAIEEFGDPSQNDLLIFMEAELVYAFSANASSIDLYARTFLPQNHRRDRVESVYRQKIRGRRPQRTTPANSQPNPLVEQPLHDPGSL